MLQVTTGNSKEFQKPRRSQYDSSPPSKWRGAGREPISQTFEKKVNVADNNLKTGHPIIRVGELPELNKGIPEGTVDTVLVTHVESPDEFYIVLKKKAEYSLDHPEWKKIFPPFNNGFEALRGLTTLLTMCHKQCPTPGPSNIARKKVTFQFGDMVSVMLEPNGETRRGLVTATTMKNVKETGKASRSHGVYLIDYGMDLTVPESCLLALPKPFHCIGPLAIKATLFGISPVAEIWDSISIHNFKEKVKANQLQKLTFSIEVMSRTTTMYGLLLKDSPLQVNLEVRKSTGVPDNKTGLRSTQTLMLNFTEELVKDKRGIPWNLFPSRPKLMEGTEIANTPPTGRGCVVGKPRFTISFRDGTLLTPYHPVIYSQLPNEVLEREVTKLLRIRRSYIMDVMGMENRLLTVINEGNPTRMKVCRTPCTIMKSSGIKSEDEKTDEDMKNLAEEFDKVVLQGHGANSRGRGRGRRIVKTARN